MSQFYTTKDVAEQKGKPEWLIRRVVDQLDPPVSRLGILRMIPAERLPEIDQILNAKAEAAK